MSSDPQSPAEWALTEVIAAEEVEVLPDVRAAFPGLERADADWIGGMSEAGALRTVAACEAAIARTQAVQLRALARLGALRDDPRSAAAEVALAVSSTESRARGQLDLAETLTTRLPHTLAAMESGSIDSYKASKVADATAVLDDATAREADEVLAERLVGKNPVGLRQAAGRVAARLDPEGADRRAAQRRYCRRVELIPRGEGMATLAADLPAEAATAIYARLDRAARKLRAPGEERTLDQLRADVFIELCLGTGTTRPDPDASEDHSAATTANASAAPTATGPLRAEVFVHISAATLAGAGDEPAEMPGHGPVPAAIARAIAHDSGTTWRRIITDPIDGQIIDVGRTRYRPPAALDELVRIRDRTCRHPGCYRPSFHGDLDHHTEWSSQNGRTSAANLVGFCRNHHRLKDEPGWAHHLDGDGTLTITTPTQRSYTNSPEAPPF